MSKLYDKFVLLKASNKDKLYLFESGIFYIALNEDAAKLSEIFGFKITNLNENTTKCGFPKKRIEYYATILEKLNIEVEKVSLNEEEKSIECENFDENQFKNIAIKLAKIDFDNLTFKQAFEMLYDMSLKTRKILKLEE